MLDDRKQHLLELIIERYIATSEPIGSQFLVEYADLPVSGATVRNEMRELEEEGYLTHPHTSAGRIPTEQGYRYYVEHLMTPETPKKRVTSTITTLLQNQDRKEKALKQIGKYISGETHTAVIVALGRDSVYYTGISELLSQNEFRFQTFVISISQMFDECEDRLEELFATASDHQRKIFIGTENPFGSACSMVIAPIYNGEELLMSIGPMRMDYEKTVGIMEFVTQEIEKNQE